MGAVDQAIENDWEQRRVLAARAFSPSAPVSKRDLLAGRLDQLRQTLAVLGADGRHCMLYGERGVGKTSLARVLLEVTSSVYVSAYVTCDSDDTFSSIWRRVLSEIKFVSETTPIGFNSQPRQEIVSYVDQVNEVKSANDAKDVLRILARQSPIVVYIDEFDRLQDEKTKTLFADLIKLLSDYVVPATICLVGVADDVSELIAEHQSIERNLEQILMPRMSEDELSDIVKNSLAALGMAADATASRRITALSQGLPHYTHLIGQQAALAAIDAKRKTVNKYFVDLGVTASLRAVQQSIADVYLEAISSSQKNMYPQVILACAIAKRSEQGYFTQPDVREPLSKIMGRQIEIPSYARHLSDLCEEKRGPILQRRGRERRYRYRFANPLMQPFVTMKGLAEGTLPDPDRDVAS